MRYYAVHIGSDEMPAKKYCLKLISIAQKKVEEASSIRENLSAIAPTLAALNDVKLLKSSRDMLVKGFLNITPADWAKLIQHFSHKHFEAMLNDLTHQDHVTNIAHWLSIMQEYNEVSSPEMMDFAKDQLERLPTYLAFVSMSRIKEEDRWSSHEIRQKNIRSIIASVIQIAARFDSHAKWPSAITMHLSKSLHRDYVNDFLRPALSAKYYSPSTVSEKLRQVVIENLKQRTKVEPTPPYDLSRDVPTGNEKNTYWFTHVIPFLQSPTQAHLDYVANERDRNTLDSVISSSGADLDTQTIAQGRPYTMRMTKNTNTYTRLHKEWAVDMGYLAEMEGE
jgi:hypothetical protein